jgi:hypothetical protein
MEVQVVAGVDSKPESVRTFRRGDVLLVAFRGGAGPALEGSCEWLGIQFDAMGADLTSPLNGVRTRIDEETDANASAR